MLETEPGLPGYIAKKRGRRSWFAGLFRASAGDKAHSATLEDHVDERAGEHFGRRGEPSLYRKGSQPPAVGHDQARNEVMKSVSDTGGGRPARAPGSSAPKAEP